MANILPPPLEALMTRVTSSNAQLLPPLRPTKTFDTSLTPQIESFAKNRHKSKSCVRAALHLLNDDIELAHSIAQGDEGEITTDLCHGILHRREGEYWNSRLWYKLIKHPLVDEVYGSTAKAQQFIDDVEAMVTNKKGASTACAAGNVETLKKKQAEELAALVRFAIQGK